MRRRKRRAEPDKVSITTRLSRVVDDAVAVLSPKRAVQRRAFRQIYEFGAAAYDAAAKDDPDMEEWVPGNPVADTWADLELSRNRARDRERNDPVAQAILRTVLDNVVGTGIRPQSRIDHEQLGVTPEFAQEWQRACERVFRRSMRYLDSRNQLDFYGMQRMVLKRAFVDGEIFVQRARVNGPNRPTDVAFELIETERVARPTGGGGETSGDRRIVDGIELGSRNQPVAYHVSLFHPAENRGILGRVSSNYGRYARVKAWNSFGMPNMLHVRALDRAPQLRGVTAFAPAMRYFVTLDDYLKAELQGKRNEACLGFIRETSPDIQLIQQMMQKDDVAYDADIEEVFNGMDVRLLPGEKMTLLDPKRPGAMFEPFVFRIMSLMGAAIGVPFVIFMKDYAKVNYSSYRGALLDFLRMCETWFQMTVQSFCQPVWEAVLFDAWARGELPAVDVTENRSEWFAAAWMPQKRDWVDPMKEAAAEEKALSTGTRTRSEILGSRGVDWEDNLRQTLVEEKREKELREEMGLGPKTPPGDEDEPEDPEKDEDDDDADSDKEE